LVNIIVVVETDLVSVFLLVSFQKMGVRRNFTKFHGRKQERGEIQRNFMERNEARRNYTEFS